MLSRQLMNMKTSEFSYLLIDMSRYH